MKAIADTGFIVAYGNQHDVYHDWARHVAQELTEPILTCESVLSEASFQLGSAAYVLSLVEDDILTLSFDLANNLEQIAELAYRYADRTPDLADLCIIRMSELYPNHVVLTVDLKDFKIYRRNRRETIPIVCPPRA